MADRRPPRAPSPPSQVPPGFEDVFKTDHPLEEGESGSTPSELETLDFADSPNEPAPPPTDPQGIPPGDTPYDPNQPSSDQPPEVPKPPPPPPPQQQQQQMLDLDTVAALFAKILPAGQPVQMTSGPPAPQSIEQSAIHLLSLLDDRYVGQLQELAAKQAQGSLALVIAGVLTQVGEQGNFGDFSLNPTWQEKIHTVPQSPSTLYTNSERRPLAQAQCEGCGHDYKPGRFQQRFCCTPCGKGAAGYATEGMPHATDCTTVPGRLLKEAALSARVIAPKSKEEEATA